MDYAMYFCVSKVCISVKKGRNPPSKFKHVITKVDATLEFCAMRFIPSYAILVT
jgi:hypothetical protein